MCRWQRKEGTPTSASGFASRGVPALQESPRGKLSAPPHPFLVPPLWRWQCRHSTRNGASEVSSGGAQCMPHNVNVLPALVKDDVSNLDGRAF